MKRIFTLLTSLAIAFSLNELIFRFVVHYPTYGIKMRLLGIRSSQKRQQNIYYPNSQYWTVEGGNHVYSRNNLGLPGVNIDPSRNNKFIFVLGTSYIEAFQVAPDKIATSVLFNALQKENREYQIVNLGFSGADPYDSYLLSLYYETLFEPCKVLLVLNSDNKEWLNRHKDPLLFARGPDFAHEDRRILYTFNRRLRNSFSSFNLLQELRPSATEGIAPPGGDETEGSTGRQGSSSLPALPQRLGDCLKAFQTRHHGRFICVSIVPDRVFNHELDSFCRKESINLAFSEEIIRPENRFQGSGHLNAQGNLLLGLFLNDAFKRFSFDPQE